MNNFLKCSSFSLLNSKNLCRYYSISNGIKTTRRKTPIATRAPLSITPAAINRIKELLKTNDTVLGVRIGVRTRGCNGLTYTLDYCQNKDNTDEEVNQDGVKVFIAAKAQLTLLGTEMDYQEGKLNSEFVFHNPNIKGTCGCGESFNL